jgi:hypothetical protein
MNPKSKEFTVAAGHKDGLSAPSSLTHSARTQPVSAEVKQHLLPIPSIVVTPFVNQLPPQAELLGYNLKNTQRGPVIKPKPKVRQPAPPAGDMSLFPSGMGGSNPCSPGSRQLTGGNSVIGPQENPYHNEFDDHASNNASQGTLMGVAYAQGQVNQHGYMTSVSHF